MALDDCEPVPAAWRCRTCTGPPPRDKVRAYASSRGYLGGLSPESAWTDEAATSWDAGFRAMELRIGRDPLDEEIDAIEGLVTASPPMTWMADGNGAYTLDESRRLGAALGELGFRWLEEPLPTDDYRRMRRWRVTCRSRWQAARSSNGPRRSRTSGLVRSTSSNPTSRSPAGSAVSSRSRSRPRRRPVRRAARLQRCDSHGCDAARLGRLPVPPDAPKWAEPILEHDVGENPIRTAILTEPLTLDDGWIRSRRTGLGSKSMRSPSAACGMSIDDAGGRRPRPSERRSSP